MPEGWKWDESLFSGSAPFYMRGRLPYASGLAEVLAKALSLDGRGRLIDVGCGPGVLALCLAHLFAEVVGVDPDGEMIAEAERRAGEAGVAGKARWVRARAEDLPAGLGTFTVATFGQSFHWMDRDLVAATIGAMLRRSIEDVRAWVFSRSESAPHLFGGRRAEFEADLRRLLRRASPAGLFCEPQPSTEVLIWREGRRLRSDRDV